MDPHGVAVQHVDERFALIVTVPPTSSQLFRNWNRTESPMNVLLPRISSDGVAKGVDRTTTRTPPPT